MEGAAEPDPRATATAAAKATTTSARKPRAARAAQLTKIELQTLAKLALVIHNGTSASGSPNGTCCTPEQAAKLRTAVGTEKKTELVTNFINFCQQTDVIRAKLDLQFVFSTSSQTRELGAMKRTFAALRGCESSSGSTAEAVDDAKQWWEAELASDGVAANCFARTMLDHGHKLLTAEALRPAQGSKAAAAAKAVAGPAAAATAQTIVAISAARRLAATEFAKKIKEVLVSGGCEKDAVTSTLQRLMGAHNMVTALTGGDGSHSVACALLQLTESNVTLCEAIDAEAPGDFPSLVAMMSLDDGGFADMIGDLEADATEPLDGEVAHGDGGATPSLFIAQLATPAPVATAPAAQAAVAQAAAAQATAQAQVEAAQAAAAQAEAAQAEAAQAEAAQAEAAQAEAAQAAAAQAAAQATAQVQAAAAQVAAAHAAAAQAAAATPTAERLSTPPLAAMRPLQASARPTTPSPLAPQLTSPSPLGFQLGSPQAVGGSTIPSALNLLQQRSWGDIQRGLVAHMTDLEAELAQLSAVRQSAISQCIRNKVNLDASDMNLERARCADEAKALFPITEGEERIVRQLRRVATQIEVICAQHTAILELISTASPSTKKRSRTD